MSAVVSGRTDSQDERGLRKCWSIAVFRICGIKSSPKQDGRLEAKDVALIRVLLSGAPHVMGKPGI